MKRRAWPTTTSMSASCETESETDSVPARTARYLARAIGARRVLVWAMVVLAGCDSPAPPAAPTFDAFTTVDAEAGWEIVVLRYAASDPARTLEARIAPAAGGNLFSFRVGAEELLVQPEKLSDLTLHRAGTPILFPTPNRVRKARMVFGNRVFAFPANSGENFIHGLVRSRPWSHGPPNAALDQARSEMWIDWDKRQPHFSLFPIAHRLAVTHTLRADGIRIAYEVQNRGREPLPFGFGLHPWFRVPGERRDVLLRVPAGYRMEAEEKLPTGALVPVAGTSYDLRAATPLEGLDLDDVYWGLAPERLPAFEWRDRGIRVTLGGSADFTHIVVYTPPGQPFFCIENQTSSTDAHNLWSRGFVEESNLQVVEPGGSAAGFVDWKVERPSTQ